MLKRKLTPPLVLAGLLWVGTSAQAEPSLKFRDFKKYSVLELRGQNLMMRKCLTAGLVLKFRYTAQLCRRQRYWFDDCGKERRSYAEIRFDPILLGYTVDQDLLDDGKATKRFRFGHSQSAFDLASRSKEFFYDFLGGGLERFGVYPLYVRYKAKVYCNENYNQTIDRIAKFISFGLLDLGDFDSDWQESVISPSDP